MFSVLLLFYALFVFYLLRSFTTMSTGNQFLHSQALLKIRVNEGFTTSPKLCRKRFRKHTEIVLRKYVEKRLRKYTEIILRHYVENVSENIPKLASENMSKYISESIPKLVSETMSKTFPKTYRNWSPKKTISKKTFFLSFIRIPTYSKFMQVPPFISSSGKWEENIFRKSGKKFCFRISGPSDKWYGTV